MTGNLVRWGTTFAVLMAVHTGAHAQAFRFDPSPNIETDPFVLQVRTRREVIIDRLRADGFTNVNFQGRRLLGYVVHGCRDGKKFLFRFDPLLKERGRRVIGDCASRPGASARLDLVEIRRQLRDEGYRRIRFTDRQLPRYVATACRNGRAFTLRINSRGEIVRSSRTGLCRRNAKVVTQQELRQSMRALGFYNIRFLSRDNPPSRAEACKARRNYAIRIARDGTIVSREHKGPCTSSANYSSRDLRTRLQRRGYYEINLVRNQNNVAVFEACRSVRKFRLRVASNGNIRARQLIGWCSTSPEKIPARPTSILNHFPSAKSLNPEDCDDYLNALLERTRIRFETNSSAISNRSARLLEEVGQIMNMCPASKIEVAGHTDNRGSNELNERLSRERARSVVRYLARNFGVRRNRLDPNGYGETRPIASNRTERGRARNRRIEMVVLWGD
jgi:outer membrane protein OmpA-like peptidoglycan-associated protein